MLWFERQGTEGPLVLLLHGLGATGAVWSGVLAALSTRPVRSLVVDLPGHGGSSWRETYSVGEMAADIAPLLHEESGVHVLGHSLGVYVGLALASGWFNVEIASVTGIGPKVSWSAEDFARIRELARRPLRHFPARDEALERYRRVSGLDPATAPGEACLARGIVAETDGYRLAADPRTFAVGAPPFAGLVSLAFCPVTLACGEGDGMVSVAELREFRADAVELRGLGHNAHVEAPEVALDLFEPRLAAA